MQLAVAAGCCFALACYIWAGGVRLGLQMEGSTTPLVAAGATGRNNYFFACTSLKPIKFEQCNVPGRLDEFASYWFGWSSRCMDTVLAFAGMVHERQRINKKQALLGISMILPRHRFFDVGAFFLAARCTAITRRYQPLAQTVCKHRILKYEQLTMILCKFV